MKYTMSCMRLVPIKVVVEADDLNTARKELWKKLSKDDVESKYRHELMYAVDEDGFHFDAFNGKFIRSNSIRWEVDDGVAIKVKS